MMRIQLSGAYRRISSTSGPTLPTSLYVASDTRRRGAVPAADGGSCVLTWLTLRDDVFRPTPPHRRGRNEAVLRQRSVGAKTPCSDEQCHSRSFDCRAREKSWL